MICGNCKGEHPHAYDVRKCYEDGLVGFAAARTEVIDRANLATEKQMKFVRALMAERPNYSVEQGYDEMPEELDKNTASTIIADLLEHPKELALPEEGPDVPPGYYAVPSLSGNNDLDFFVIEEGKGRWEGHLFVNRIVGGHPDAPVPRSQRAAVKKAIVAITPEAAAIRYGQEIGRCYKCNRHLTDELSRQLGIGPVCREGA